MVGHKLNCCFRRTAAVTTDTASGLLQLTYMIGDKADELSIRVVQEFLKHGHELVSSAQDCCLPDVWSVTSQSAHIEHENVNHLQLAERDLLSSCIALSILDRATELERDKSCVLCHEHRAELVQHVHQLLELLLWSALTLGVSNRLSWPRS